jgi:hypothetical protein
MRKYKKWIAVAGAGLAVLMLTVVALPAAAAGTVSASVQHRGGPMGGGVNETYLAQALGITAAELQTAQQTAYVAGIDQALAKGLITQAQADALKQGNGEFGRFGGRELHGFLGLAGDTSIDPNALLAKALGITTEDLQAARVKAQDLALAQAVTDGRITQEQADQMKAEQALKTYLDGQGLQTQMQTLYQDAVKQAVKAGVITQAQADAILSNQGTFGMFGHHGGMRGFEGFEGSGGMHGFNGRGGMRGFDAPGNAAPNSATPNNPTPSGFYPGGATSGSRL